MNHKEKADMLHKKGYNCCQSVLIAFQDELKVDPEILFRIGEGFGLGMGNMDQTCGALSAAVMIAGLKNSDGNLAEPKSKRATYQLADKLQKSFLEKSGALVCRELKGIKTGKVLCPCPVCISNAVEIVEDMLGSELTKD